MQVQTDNWAASKETIVTLIRSWLMLKKRERKKENAQLEEESITDETHYLFN